MLVDTVSISVKANSKRSARALQRALIKFMKKTNEGGYSDLYIAKGDGEEPELCGQIGLDVTIVSIGLQEMDRPGRRKKEAGITFIDVLLLTGLFALAAAVLIMMEVFL